MGEGGAAGERRMGALRRRLEAMQYQEDLDPRSAPLVERLVGDLVHTTEAYRALKIRNSGVAHELGAEQGKVRAPAAARAPRPYQRPRCPPRSIFRSMWLLGRPGRIPLPPYLPGHPPPTTPAPTSPSPMPRIGKAA